MFTGRLSPVSNRATWIEQIGLTDTDSEEPIDLEEADIVVEVRDPETKCLLLSATTDNDKVEIIDGEDGIFQWTFSVDEMSDLCAGIYDVGITVTQEDVVTQLMAGSIQVIDGVVS